MSRGWPNRTFAGFVGYPGYLGDATHYFDGIGRIYIDLGTSTVPTFAGASMSLGPITLSKTAGEPDSSVFTVLASWSPRRFAQLGGCRYEAQAGQPACTGARSRGPGFEVTWNVPSFATIAYEVRRSGTSIKTAGFNSGLCNNGAGIAAANGAFTVHVVDASRGVCSVTTTAPHGLKPSMWVMVSGSTNAILGQLRQGAETNWQITAVEDGNHFRFACPKAPDGTYSQDYQKNYPFSLRVFPAIAITGTGNGEWTTGGTVVSTEPTRNFTETKVTALPQ
jgi:hypothetical protein